MDEIPAARHRNSTNSSRTGQSVRSSRSRPITASSSLRSRPLVSSTRSSAGERCSISASIRSPSPRCCWVRPTKIMAIVEPASPASTGRLDDLSATPRVPTRSSTRRWRRERRREPRSRVRKPELRSTETSTRPDAFSLISPDGTVRRFEFDTQGRGLHYEAAEVARCVRCGTP